MIDIKIRISPGGALSKNSTMGQSLVKQYIHIIYSTKHQQPLIIDSVEEELYKYIGGICKKMECYPVKVGG